MNAADRLRETLREDGWPSMSNYEREARRIAAAYLAAATKNEETP